MAKKSGKLIPTLITAAVGIGMTAFLALNSPAEYSPEWFRSLSDDELRIQQEKVRLQAQNGNKKAKERLPLFDAEIRRRKERKTK